MAIKLGPDAVKPTSPVGDVQVATGSIGALVGDWILQRRERSKWNPPAPSALGASASAADIQRSEPLWADTQPWWHD